MKAAANDEGKSAAPPAGTLPAPTVAPADPVEIARNLYELHNWLNQRVKR